MAGSSSAAPAHAANTAGGQPTAFPAADHTSLVTARAPRGIGTDVEMRAMDRSAPPGGRKGAPAGSRPEALGPAAGLDSGSRPGRAVARAALCYPRRPGIVQEDAP